MDKKKFKEMRKGHIRFKIHELYGGGLYMYVYDCFGHRIDFGCDEILSDIVPDMIIMYNKLKQRIPFSFVNGNDWLEIHFSISDFNSTYDKKYGNKYVCFSVRVGLNGEPPAFTEMAQTLPIDYLLMEFELFFDTLLHHPDFPFQFPCCDAADEDQVEFADNECEARYSDLHLPEAELRKRYKECVRRRVTKLSEDGMEYLEQYKQMLKTRTLPEGWW